MAVAATRAEVACGATRTEVVPAVARTKVVLAGIMTFSSSNDCGRPLTVIASGAATLFDSRVAVRVKSTSWPGTAVAGETCAVAWKGTLVVAGTSTRVVTASLVRVNGCASDGRVTWAVARLTMSTARAAGASPSARPARASRAKRPPARQQRSGNVGLWFSMAAPCGIGSRSG